MIGENVIMKWTKSLSRTDAQQKTKGYPVQYLRFIKGNNPHNNQTWFRQTFFGTENWIPGFHGRHAVQECSVPIEVTVSGVSKGVRHFRVTHDSSRTNNHSTPNTYLHYDPATVADLRATNLTGQDAVIEKLKSGVYTLSLG
jgi:hypothetical protein